MQTALEPSLGDTDYRVVQPLKVVGSKPAKISTNNVP